MRKHSMMKFSFQLNLLGKLLLYGVFPFYLHTTLHYAHNDRENFDKLSLVLLSHGCIASNLT